MADCFSWFADAEIAVHEMAIADASQAELLPEERAHVGRAVPKRVREFAAGRICARRAIVKLGLAPAAIPAGADRAPVWPDGVIGSITHADGHCAAAVARAGGGIAAIGLDLEEAAPLPEGVLEIVCSAEEQAWLQAQPAAEREILARAIFSAKECAYKAQYTLSRQMLEFHDLRLDLDPAQGRFATTFLRDAAPFARGQTISGRLRIATGRIACAMVLRPGLHVAGQ
jgi:4'-phosphopantetheinyl transferase EntD